MRSLIFDRLASSEAKVADVEKQTKMTEQDNVQLLA